MVTTVARLIRNQMLKVVFWQLILIVIVSMLFGLFLGLKKGASAFLGGLTYWLPTLIYVWRVTLYAGAREAIRFVVAFSVGELVKLFLSGVLFVLIIKYLQVDILYAVIGLIVAIVSFWTSSFVSLYQGEKR